MLDREASGQDGLPVTESGLKPLQDQLGLITTFATTIEPSGLEAPTEVVVPWIPARACSLPGPSGFVPLRLPLSPPFRDQTRLPLDAEATGHCEHLYTPDDSRQLHCLLFSLRAAPPLCDDRLLSVYDLLRFHR